MTAVVIVFKALVTEVTVETTPKAPVKPDYDDTKVEYSVVEAD